MPNAKLGAVGVIGRFKREFGKEILDLSKDEKRREIDIETEIRRGGS